MDINNLCLSCFKERGNTNVCKHCGYVVGTPPKNPYCLRPGVILSGRYLIGTVVGSGGFGIVYKAWDCSLNTLVAVKEFYPAGLVNRVPGETDVVIYSGEKRDMFDASLRRFLSEARCQAKFAKNPNIVRVYDFFQENNTAYIVMEFLQGISLKDFVAQNGGKLNVNTAVDIMESVLDALRDIHSKGFVHRDISPDNIYITNESKIKLLDFGAARLSSGEKETTMSVILKPGYAPAEQYREKSRQGPFTDVYAAGATFYRIITGKVPLESTDRLKEDTLKRPSEIVPEIPDYIDKAIMKAMALKEGLRFQNCSYFLDAISNKRKVEFPEVELAARKKKRKILATIGAAAILAAIVCGVLAFNSMHVSDEVLNIWLPESRQSAFDAAIEEFHSKKTNNGIIGNIEVEAAYYPDDEYERVVASAVNRGNVPDLFFAENIDGSITSDIASSSLKEMLLSVSSDATLLRDYDASTGTIPTGISTTVVYVNNNRARGVGVDVSSDSEIDIADYVNDAYLLIGTADRSLTGGEVDIKYYDSDALGMEALESGELLFFVGKTETITVVDSTRRALYGTLSPVRLGIDPNFELSNRICVTESANATANRKAATQWFIKYLISDDGQDVLYVRHDSGALPINDDKLVEYVTETNTAFSFISLDDVARSAR